MHRLTGLTSASSNDDYKASDVMFQLATPTCVYQNQVQETLSAYKSLDINTQVVISKDSNPYEELHNDIWKEIFPTKYIKQIAGVQVQPILDVSSQQATTQTPSRLISERIETSQILLNNIQTDDEWKYTPPLFVNNIGATPNDSLKSALLTVYPAYEAPLYTRTELLCNLVKTVYEVLSKDVEVIPGENTEENEFCNFARFRTTPEQMTTSPLRDEYDTINDYEDIQASHEPLMVDGMQCLNHRQPCRPLPVIPMSIYETLQPCNPHAGSKVSRRMCILISQMVLMLTVVVAAVVIAVVITVFVLNIANAGNLGKLFSIQ